MKKIWDVDIGNSWSSHTVQARNYKEAGKKALQLSGANSNNRYVARVNLIREIEE